MGVRGDCASPRSTRHGAARLEDRGGEGEPATSHRGGSHESPPRAEACHRRTRAVGVSGRRAATDSQVQGPWRSLARAVEKPGQTREGRLTEPRATAAARRGRTPAHAPSRRTAPPASCARCPRGRPWSHRRRAASSGCPGRCGEAQRARPPTTPWAAATSCTCARTDRGALRPEPRAARRPHRALPWLRHPSPDKGHGPFITS